MIATCTQCHSPAFAKSEMARSDDMVREADHLMAQAIRIVAGLYQDGIVPKPKDAAYAFPDLLTFHDAGTVVEQKLFVMFLEHRMRTFQGAFHNNPDYSLWYGWSEMKRDLSEIRALDKEMRAAAHGREEGQARREEVVNGEETRHGRHRPPHGGAPAHPPLPRRPRRLRRHPCSAVGDDRAELSRFVRFIREFADVRHHGKEENFLFEAMMAGGFPRDGGPDRRHAHGPRCRASLRGGDGREGGAGAPLERRGSAGHGGSLPRLLQPAPQPHPQGGPDPLPDGPAAAPRRGAAPGWTVSASPSRRSKSPRGTIR